MGGRGSSGGAGGSSQISGKNLPSLTGSEKQISWAKDIRKGFIDSWNKDISRSLSEGDDYYKTSEGRDFVKNLSYIANNITKSSTWINNRGRVKPLDPNNIVYEFLDELDRGRTREQAVRNFDDY